MSAPRHAWLCLLGVLGCAPPTKVPPDYATMFESSRVAGWQIRVATDEWRHLLVDPATYVEAELAVDDRHYARVGLRLMGNERRAKRSMRIRFNEFVLDQRYHGVKRVNLRRNGGDPSQIREVLALELLRACGVPAPRASLVWVQLNDDTGALYTLVEQVDRKFLEDRFGEDRGALYKLERGSTLADVDGALASYELKTEEENPDTADLLHFIDVLNHAPSGTLHERLGRLLDLEGLLRYFAVNTWLVNLDSYLGTADNLYLYRDEAGQFHVIPWDLSRAFGNYHGPSCALRTEELMQLDPEQPTCGGPRPLVDRVLQLSELRQRYRELLAEFLDGPLAVERVRARMAAWHELARSYALQDLLHEYSGADFNASLTDDTPPGDNPVRAPGLEPFVARRAAYLREWLGDGE